MSNIMIHGPREGREPFITALGMTWLEKKFDADMAVPKRDGEFGIARVPNLTISSEERFWDYIGSYGVPEFTAWVGSHVVGLIQHQTKGRRPAWESRDEWGHLTLFFVNHSQWQDGGFAVVNVYSPEHAVRYYTWGACKHEYQSATIGNCLTRHTCTKCGHLYDVDSSD